MSIRELGPTSLADLLFMYSKAEDLCYVDFMEGAKALVTFMAPIEIPEISSKLRLPDLLGGYVASELAKIIAPHTVLNAKTTHQVEVAICWVMMQDVFPKLQAQWENEGMKYDASPSPIYKDRDASLL